MKEKNAFKILGVGAISVVALAAMTLTGIAVVNQYKNTGLVDNDTATAFITGLAIFGSFSTVVVISIIGKVIIGMYKGQTM